MNSTPWLSLSIWIPILFGLVVLAFSDRHAAQVVHDGLPFLDLPIGGLYGIGGNAIHIQLPLGRQQIRCVAAWRIKRINPGL